MAAQNNLLEGRESKNGHLIEFSGDRQSGLVTEPAGTPTLLGVLRPGIGPERPIETGGVWPEAGT